MDLAEGYLSALNYLIKEKPRIFNLNLGTGLFTRVLELINTFQKVNKVTIPYEFEEKRNGDKAILVLDNLLAIKVLNCKPEINLEDICNDGWKWKLKNPNVFS